jgi:hypothetical protein
MILTRVLDFLAQREVASLAEIAQAVGSTPDAVRSMLQTLQRKGRIHRLPLPEGCGSSCRQCAQGTIEVYGLGAEMPVPGVQLRRCAERSD